MCRSIKTLFNFDPPATHEDVRLASLQFVRKLSGFKKPSHVNEETFNRAVEEIAGAADRLLHSLKTAAPAHNRAQVEAKARARRQGVN
jgi:hypothetical protein